MGKLYVIVLVCFAFLGHSSNALSQTITIVQPLSFGTIAIRNYTDPVSMTLQSSDSSYVTNANTYIVDLPQRGEYDISSAPANTAYSITLPPSVTLVGPGDSFTLDNFNTSPAVTVSDGSGNATFFIGGRITTVGGFGMGDGSYDDTFNVTVNF